MNVKLENPFDEVKSNGKVITTEANAEPLDWSLFAKQAGIRGTPKTAAELIDTTFDILRGKPFESSYEKQDHAWFCIVRPVGQDELFETTLGGQALVEILDAYAKSGLQNPMRVTLDFVKSGKNDGYYQFK